MKCRKILVLLASAIFLAGCGKVNLTTLPAQQGGTPAQVAAPVAADRARTLPKRAKTTRVNVSSSGTQANGETRGVAISGDGRYVVFTSDATTAKPFPASPARAASIVALRARRLV